MIFIDHSEDKNEKITIVDITGELNSDTSIDFEEYINQLILKHKIFIILNAAKLDYISSGGIGVILYVQKKILAARGFFILCNISEEISALYGILGFDKVIRIAGNREEAVDIMQKQLVLIESEVREEPVSAETPHEPEQKADKEAQGTGSLSGEETMFSSPIILECSGCKGLIRIRKSGTYICPDCRTEFSVEPDQTIVF